LAAVINTISIREFTSATFLANKIREQNPKAKICFLSVITTFNEDFRKTRLVLGKTINEDYFIQMSVDMEDLLKKLTSIRNTSIPTIFIYFCK
jgi:hypothetical protein